MELFFKGKEFVYNHHLTVPFRPLEPHPDKSVGDGNLDGNLVIHGDNLHGLKALLPRYAGKVDCIFIDPPYNTGNENWCYNDNVNNPIMKEWLSSNPINREDMLRHDKWCAMMWPRLKLLHELLAETGSLWMTLDDNEVHRARMMLDEIFGDQCFVASCVWQKNYSPKNSAQFFSEDHDHLLVVAKDKDVWRPNLLQRTEEMEDRYSNPDDDPRGPWKAGDLSARNFYGEGTYPIECPSGRIIEGPPAGRYWVVSQEKFSTLNNDNRIWWGESGNNSPAVKRFLSEVQSGRVPQTLWFYSEVGHTQDAKKTLLEMDLIRPQDATMTPKPVALIERVLELACDSNSLVLDSFAGSGTTAHAVLEANRKDGGNRRFILVECEEYADTLTAERVRRVINGYPFTGKHKEELLREKLTWTKFRNAEALQRKVNGLEALHGSNFDRINKIIKNGELIVCGEKEITESYPGLGGAFTYCTLGAPVDIDALLTGENLPDYASMGAWIYYTATNQALPPDAIDPETFYLGESSQYHVWLIYKPDLEYLMSNDSALTLSRAEAISRTHNDKRHLVFAPVKFVPNKILLPLGVEFAQLPYAIYRREVV